MERRFSTGGQKAVENRSQNVVGFELALRPIFSRRLGNRLSITWHNFSLFSSIDTGWLLAVRPTNISA